MTTHDLFQPRVQLGAIRHLSSDVLALLPEDHDRDAWARRTRRLLAVAQFAVQLGSRAEAAEELLEAIAHEWLGDETHREVMRDIQRYVHALYKGSIRTAEQRLSTAHRRIANRESEAMWREDCAAARNAAHEHRGEADALGKAIDVAFADLLIAEASVLLGDMPEAHRRASAAMEGAWGAVTSSASEFTATNPAGDARSRASFRESVESADFVMHNAAELLVRLGGEVSVRTLDFDPPPKPGRLAVVGAPLRRATAGSAAWVARRVRRSPEEYRDD
jgi:hypothetical protein